MTALQLVLTCFRAQQYRAGLDQLRRLTMPCVPLLYFLKCWSADALHKHMISVLRRNPYLIRIIFRCRQAEGLRSVRRSERVDPLFQRPIRHLFHASAKRLSSGARTAWHTHRFDTPSSSLQALDGYSAKPGQRNRSARAIWSEVPFSKWTRFRRTTVKLKAGRGSEQYQ